MFFFYVYISTKKGIRRLNRFFSLKNLLIFLIVVIFAINIFLIASYFSESKEDSSKRPSNQQIRETSFYNQPCPQVEMEDVQGNKIRLSSLSGNVILLRFTKFYLKDLSSLLYLEYIQGKLKDEGLYTFFIFPSEREESKEYINRFVDFSIPIIKDNSSLLQAFQSRVNETIIIGRDFRIKFKKYLAQNRTIYHQINRFLYGKFSPSATSSTHEISPLIKKISYLNLGNNKIETIYNQTRNRTAIINLFISPCFRCPESQRVKLIKNLFSKIDSKRVKAFFLFGRGNNVYMIEEFIEKNGLFGKNYRVGIIKDFGELEDKDYYGLFDLEINPRLFILSAKGKITFLETIENQRKINLNLLVDRLR